jgi:ketosteroid isomerase-like protein
MPGKILATTLVAIVFAACIGECLADDSSDVIDTQQRRLRAMVEADRVALEALLADDLVYIHTTGVIDTKSSLIESIVSGIVDYTRLVTTDATLRLAGNVAIVTGTADLGVLAGGTAHAAIIRFTEVYVDTDDGWRLVSWQSTRVP